ncbi:MAG TPA: NAD-dependent epimerase/dehydratase family protein [Candidatus Eisenbacteria bacterium]|nr:NAD-dependent epimerase/dehydratase family protein [Candidatus Eisenbacteria bacterium]
MRYFVTGATGFIGGRLARRLRAAGHEVTALVRSPSRAAELAALDIALAPGDITDPATLRAPMRGADGVFHVAAWYGFGLRAGRQAERVNVEGTRHVLEAVRALGIPRGVYTSTLAVFSDTRGRVVDESYRFTGRHLTRYDDTKARAHALAESMMGEGLPLVIVQPGVVYGPGDTSALHDSWVAYLRRRLPVVPAGTAYCWAHVDDVVHAHVLAMERGRPGESYIVAGSCHSLVDAFAIAERITGIPAPRLHPPRAVMRALAAVAGVAERVLPLPPTYTREGLVSTSGVTYLGDNAKARRELGYAPRPLEEGLRETLAWEMRALGMPTPAS